MVIKALSHGAISCNLQRFSFLGRCKIGKYTFPSQFANIFLTYQTFVTNLHLLRVELRCKLPRKLHRVTGPLMRYKKKRMRSLDMKELKRGGKRNVVWQLKEFIVIVIVIVTVLVVVMMKMVVVDVVAVIMIVLVIVLVMILVIILVVVLMMILVI